MKIPVIWGYFFRRKATMSILEGSAGFICREIIGTTINPTIYEYGFENEEELKIEFADDLKSNDFSGWLYNGTRSGERPADLGYFIGHQVCSTYLNGASDHQKAKEQLLQCRNPWKILVKSQYFY